MQEEDVDFEEEKRRVWLWIHPAAEEEAMVEIRKACTLEGAPWVGEIQVHFEVHRLQWAHDSFRKHGRRAGRNAQALS